MHNNDWTKNCYNCGSSDLRINDHMFTVKNPNEKKYYVLIYGAVCNSCQFLKYAIQGHKNPLDISHARWWTFGQQYEFYSGRPTRWDEALAQSVHVRLLHAENPEIKWLGITPFPDDLLPN
jgi:hypothetical protein